MRGHLIGDEVILTIANLLRECVRETDLIYRFGGEEFVIILTDDQGYADFSFNPDHPPEVSTPHMDALAREGVYFSQAYTSGAVCSPTRAGLMLGRYQQRVGVYTAGDGGSGFDPSIPIFPSRLPADYRSMVIGKWHLGLDDDYPELKWHALNRGFDECYKFMGRGGHDYFQLKGVKNDSYAPLYRNHERIRKEDYRGYLTTRLTQEAISFIQRSEGEPFFLYLAYNAVHAPAQAPKEDIEKVRQAYPHLSPTRSILMAMLKHLDDGVGEVVAALKDQGLWHNTLLFFLTDNGGAKAMEANNGCLRGFKSSLFEGGIRTPWVISWPAKFRGGRRIKTPVISLDILPTTLAATGYQALGGEAFDGVNLLPLLTGEAELASRTLFWDSGQEKAEWAVRQGNYKLHSIRGVERLIDLKKDPSERRDIADENPAMVESLTTLRSQWQSEMRRSEETMGFARKKRPRRR